MQITIVRKEFTDTYTIGELYLNGVFFCYTMEDKDRGITEDDSITDIKKVKIVKRTAIPYGDYRIMLSYSVKLKRFLPLILDVPGFRGIRIHKGSTEEWSSGCVLVGMEKLSGKLNKIVDAEKKLLKALKAINEVEPIYIKIVKNEMPSQ